jgi:hypothetical protein
MAYGERWGEEVRCAYQQLELCDQLKLVDDLNP